MLPSRGCPPPFALHHSDALGSIVASVDALSALILGAMANKAAETTNNGPELHYVQYEPAKEELFLPVIRQLISKDLSEPYSIYVYRYFLYQWGDLCYMVCFFSINVL